MPVKTDYARRTALCDWLTENGINPREVPVDGDLTIIDTERGRVIRCEVYVRSPERSITLNDRGDDEAREMRTVPLVVEPPVWWEPYEKPTREQLLAIVERVRALHRGPRAERHGSGCVQCGILWPCPTARILDGTEQPGT
ncbi:hypothetical protein AB0H77_15595 [Streptomyces sp. NPDC050844]|uniref:hypothetical protein n=1 Tax=Streptomyces sp. NPDC050844 TaxID=3155790 RepID=UPI00340B4631